MVSCWSGPRSTGVSSSPAPPPSRALALAAAGRRIAVFKPAITGLDPNAKEETQIERPASDSAPFSSLAFKLMTDPFVGQLTFIRVYSGVLTSGSSVYNATKGKRERIGV